MEKIEKMIFENVEIEMIMIDGEPFFELYAVGQALGYETKNLKGIVYPHKVRINKTVVNADIEPCVHGVHKYLNEEMIYEFMFEAKTKKCKTFRKWLAHEVLPALRKDGMYINGEENIETPEELEARVEKCLKQKIIRKYGKISTRKLNDIMKKEWGYDGNKCGRLVNDLIYMPIFGRTSNQLKKETNVINLRDEYFSIEELNMIRNAEAVIIALIKNGHAPEDVRKYIMEEHKAIREKNLQVKFAM